MKTFVKELVYKGCKDDFIEDIASSSFAITFDIIVSFVSAALLTGIFVVSGLLFKIYEVMPSINSGVFAFFVTVLIFLMTILYLPSLNLQEKYLKSVKIKRPFYFIVELDEEKVELKIDFDRSHKRTNKQYKINLNLIEGIGSYYESAYLTSDRFIKNGKYVKVEDNPAVQFIKIDTSKVASLSNIGDRKLSYIVPRYDDNGIDILVELEQLLEK